MKYSWQPWIFICRLSSCQASCSATPGVIATITAGRPPLQPASPPSPPAPALQVHAVYLKISCMHVCKGDLQFQPPSFYLPSTHTGRQEEQQNGEMENEGEGVFLWALILLWGGRVGGVEIREK